MMNNWERQQARRKRALSAAASREARGTNWVSILWRGSRLPEWIGKDDPRSGRQRIWVRNGLVLDQRKVPLCLISKNTLRIVQWFTLKDFKKIWPRMVASSQEPFGFADWVLAPEDAAQTGELP